MTKTISIYKTLLIIFFLAVVSAGNVQAADAKKIEWDSLIPPDWNPYELFDAMTDEQYDALSEEEYAKLAQKAQAMLDAAPVNDSLNDQQVKIPGFVLPLEFNGTKIKEFLLVPYFGACTHSPPPPANQIIYGKLTTEEEFDSIYDPVWITGTLKTTRESNILNEAGVSQGLDVQSAYSMTVDLIEPYDE